MIAKSLQKFADTFNEFASKNQQHRHLSEPIKRIYFALHEILGATGYHVISQESFDELYTIHMEYDEYKRTREEHILDFVLQLTQLTPTYETFNQYSLLCDDKQLIYDLLYKNREFILYDNTIVCDRAITLKLFLENGIITTNSQHPQLKS